MKDRSTAKRLGLCILNAWIVFHFLAVSTGPASVPPSTDLARGAWQMCSGYLELFYLNHGYHFFAPEPSGSTLLSYEVTRPDGSVDWGRMPSVELSPRLRYHRHFMLTEHMAANFAARPELKPDIVKAFASQIARAEGGNHLVLNQVQHELSSPEQVRSGRPIDDPITYNELLLGEFKWNIAAKPTE